MLHQAGPGEMAAAGTGDALELSPVNDLRNVAVAAENVGAFRAEHGMAKQIAFEVNLAADELVTNTIGYGYDDDREHRIDLVLRLEAGALAIEIADDGRAFDPLRAPAPDIAPHCRIAPRAVSASISCRRRWTRWLAGGRTGATW